MSTTMKSPPGDSGNKQTTTKDEGSINFRPSPNFKHMKKYLKSKFEEDMNSSATGEQEFKTEIKNKVNVEVQPPLPPYTPPPDNPLSIVKQEVEDDGYEQTNADGVKEPEPEQVENNTKPDTKKPKMCRDFVRNECIRGSSCNYAHEIDLSQLEGVYQFCRDFENARCYRPICYFVHATTFEKECFFRTAKLPPHTLAHIPKNTKKRGPTEVSPIYLTPPPPVLRSAGAPPPMPNPAPPCSAPLKREWRDTEDFTSQLRECEGKEPLAKKCKRCELTELRLQHSKTQVTQAMRSLREIDDKLELVNKRYNRLHELLRILVKPRRTLEHVNMNTNFLGSSRLSTSPLAEDNNKEALLAQMKMLLTKILLGGDNSSVAGATTAS